MGATRTAIRQAVGERIGDVIIGTITEPGTTTTFIDDEEFLLPEGTLIGRLAYCASGTAANIGKQRRIVANDEDTGEITVNPALPADVATGDVIELWHANTMGPKPKEVHRAINNVIEGVKEDVLTAYEMADFTFDAETPEATLDDEMDVVNNVYWQDHYSAWHSVPPADWSVDRHNWTVTINGVARYRADGYSVRILGFSYQEPLASDDETTEVDFDYIVNRVCEHLSRGLALRHSESSRGFWSTRATEFNQLAEMALRSIYTRPSVGKIITRLS